jgi:hypothetical protein
MSWPATAPDTPSGRGSNRAAPARNTSRRPVRARRSIGASRTKWRRRWISGGRCQALLLVASSPFLGELRSCLGAAAAGAVVGSEGLDLTELPTLELQHRLAELIAAHGEGSS